VTKPTAVRFSVRWTGARRVVLWFALVGTVAAGVALIVYRWFWLAPVPLPAAVGLLAAVRYDVSLVGPRLVRRGPFGHRRVDLRQASLSVEPAALGILARRRLFVTAPTLVVRAARRAIKLPLGRRTGHQRIDGKVVVAWLPPEELFALADGVAWFGRAPNRDKVAHFLRTVARSDYELSATVDDQVSRSGRIVQPPRSWPTDDS
jgi:hypothetical protein